MALGLQSKPTPTVPRARAREVRSPGQWQCPRRSEHGREPQDLLNQLNNAQGAFTRILWSFAFVVVLLILLAGIPWTGLSCQRAQGPPPSRKVRRHEETATASARKGVHCTVKLATNPSMKHNQTIQRHMIIGQRVLSQFERQVHCGQKRPI